MRNLLEKAKRDGLYARVDAYESEMIDEIAKLVAIPSLPAYVNADGLNMSEEVVRALHAALELAERLGFRTHNEHDNYGWAEVGDHGPLVCIFTHLDIVAVGDHWTRNPLELTREGDFLYGRGVLDNKGPAVSSLYALKSCCDMGVEWPCRVRVWFGTNEETGMNDVQLYIRDYGVPDVSFVPDSQFPLSYSELNTTGCNLCRFYDSLKSTSPLRLTAIDYHEHANCVPPAAVATLLATDEALAREQVHKVTAFADEKGMRLFAEVNGCEVRIRSEGVVAAHWNEPWTATNALAQLVLFLDTISLGEEPDELIHFVATRIGCETDGAALGIKTVTDTAELSLALSTAELNEFGLAFGLFILFPAEMRVENVYNPIFRQLRTSKLRVLLKSMKPGFLHDKEMPLIKTLYESYSEVTGNTDPIKVCGGTYAKFVPNAIPFGAIFGEEQDICHTPDEHIRVSSELMVWTKIYANALLRIADNLERLVG